MRQQRQQSATAEPAIFGGLQRQPPRGRVHRTAACVRCGAKRRDLEDYFEAGELAGIYLNFSDPWPKARHFKRRLTYRQRLLNYKKVLGRDGFVEFKTDNDGLYEFSLDEIKGAGLEITEASKDLHACGFESGRFTTEYEDKFIKAGKNINYVKFK